MTLRIALVLIALAAALGHWHHLMGRYTTEFFAFVSQNSLSEVFTLVYAQMLTVGEMWVFSWLGVVEEQAWRMRLWSTLAFVGFGVGYWHAMRQRSVPLLFVFVTCLNPYLVMAIVSGQLTAAWVGCVFFSLILLRNRQFVWAGLVLGVGSCFSLLTWFLIPAFGFLLWRQGKPGWRGLGPLLIAPLVMRALVFGDQQSWGAFGFSPFVSDLLMMASNVGFHLAGSPEATFVPFVMIVAGIWIGLWVLRARSGPSLAGDVWWVAGALLTASMFLPNLSQGVLAACLPFLMYLSLKSRLAAKATLLMTLGLWVDQHTWLHSLQFGEVYEHTSLRTHRATWFTPVDLALAAVQFAVLALVAWRLWLRKTQPERSFSWPEKETPLAMTMERLRDSLSACSRFRLGPKEFGFLAVLTLLALAFNLVDLGSDQLPSKQGRRANALVKFAPDQDIAGLWMMTNGGAVWPKFKCSWQEPWHSGIVHFVRLAYRWNFQLFPRVCRGQFVMAFPKKDSARVFELLPFDPEGNRVQPEEICSPDGKCLNASSDLYFNEQHLVDGIPRVQDGAIYDERFNFGPGLRGVGPIWELKKSSHPFFGRLWIKLSTDHLGNSPFAWRLPGAIIGALLPLMVFFLAREVSTKAATAYLAALISFADNARVALSTIAVTEPQIVFYSLLAIFFFMRGLKQWARDGQPGTITTMLCIASLGAATGTKLSGLFLAPMMILLTGLAVVYWTRRSVKIVVTVLAGVVLAMLAYALPYEAFAGRSQSADMGVWSHFSKMLAEHGVSGHSSLYASSVLTWPLVDQPVMAHIQFGLPEGVMALKLIVGNPLLWWAIVPAILYLLLRPTDLPAPAKIIAWFAVTNLACWGLVERPTYAYHFFTVATLGTIFVAYALAGHLRVRKWYALAVLVAFVWLMPLTRGWDVSQAWQWTQYWFDSWRFLPL